MKMKTDRWGDNGLIKRKGERQQGDLIALTASPFSLHRHQPVKRGDVFARSRKESGLHERFHLHRQVGILEGAHHTPSRHAPRPPSRPCRAAVLPKTLAVPSTALAKAPHAPEP